MQRIDFGPEVSPNALSADTRHDELEDPLKHSAVVAAALLVISVAEGARCSVAAAGPLDPDQPVAPPVEELVRVALDRAPSIAALLARMAAAREAVAAAGALPNPMVELMLQDASFPRFTVGTMEMSMIGPEVRQALPFPGKREARRAVARAEAAIRADEVGQLRRRLAAEVRTLYGRLYALDQERTALAAARELLDMLAATAATRYSVGGAEQEAVIKAQLEATRIEERSDDLDAERSALVAALHRLLDRAGATPLGRVTALPPVDVPAQPWEDPALASSPEVAVRRVAATAAEHRLSLVRLDLKPDFTAGAAAGLRGGLDPVVTLRFGIEVPFWRKDKQQPMIRAAEHELEMARAEVREAEAAARSQAARLSAEWERANKQIVRYRQAIVPQSSAAVDAARSSYLAGRGDFSTVVEDFRMWLEARSELARREADRFETWAQIDALINDQSAHAAAEDPASQISSPAASNPGAKPPPGLHDRGLPGNDRGAQ
jgi:outer membrane protein TolC